MNSKHGGKRPGSGRPKLKKSQKKEPTKVVRVPISLIPKIIALKEELLKKPI